MSRAGKLELAGYLVTLAALWLAWRFKARAPGAGGPAANQGEPGPLVIEITEDCTAYGTCDQ